MTFKQPTKTQGLVIVDHCPLQNCSFQVSAQSVKAAWANLQDHYVAAHPECCVPARTA